jgi:ABC-type branched-subunit amino acid transport system substrate-binding protein
MNQADLSGVDFNEILVETAESYDGITGKIDLNLAGDRISENYDFWYVVKDNSTDVFKWEAEPKQIGPNH